VARNSDANPVAESDRRGKFSGTIPREDFIRSDFRKDAGYSLSVVKIARFEIRHTAAVAAESLTKTGLSTGLSSASGVRALRNFSTLR
jgi:hypothetical protein